MTGQAALGIRATVLVDSPLAAGIGVGLVAASIGALYSVFARWGLGHGLHSADMTFLRFAVAGILMLPVLAWLLRRDARALLAQWRAWLAVSVLAGPIFGLLMFTGLEWAPASHIAVFPFTAMSVMGTVMSAWVLGERLTARKLIGIGVVISGLVILSGVTLASLRGKALIGDMLFIVAGTLWAGFGIVMSKNRLDALQATAVISFAALCTYVPVYLWSVGVTRLLAAAPSALWTEVLVQGLIAGTGTLFTYSKMVELLGAARAAVFPALAPGLAALLAWPVLGHVPEPLEALGLVIAVLGLIITVTGARRPSLETPA
ncbi:MAG: DMT family transporter [Caldimonas sp.]